MQREKQLQDCLNILLDLEPADTKDWNKLFKMGVSLEDIDNRMLVVAPLMQRTIIGNEIRKAVK